MTKTPSSLAARPVLIVLSMPYIIHHYALFAILEFSSIKKNHFPQGDIPWIQGGRGPPQSLRKKRTAVRSLPRTGHFLEQVIFSFERCGLKKAHVYPQEAIG
ncbi:hypothetical protein [Candidatus Methylacidiphilum infernorum]|uniref:hypothetical protein n=1 Tax=Candidatus Methylacidiphilum infernorum TaxID=511746 RepID=UPI00165093EC|nr:hypothetical protein [Candidatus Methylacidiphilum infernorum]